MLWRPIEKLYKKASAFRDHREETPTGISPPQIPQPASVRSSFAIPQQIDPPLGQPFPQTMPGAMPTSGVLNGAMDIDFGNNLMPIAGMDMVNNDMSWMDFQNIWEDMSTPAPQVNLGDIQWPQQVPSDQDWPCVLHQNMM